jgi:cardiolipin synthase
MLEAIEGARRRVHLETYILRGDATGRRFVAALTACARAGVEVRLLYDAFGSLLLDPSLLAPLRDAGGDAVAFNPLGRLLPSWAPRQRDHRKILVVDGEVAMTGGLNIGDEYALGPIDAGGDRVPWRDAHMRVTGPAVALLDAVFLESWFRADAPDFPWTDIVEPALATGDDTVGVLPDGPTHHRRRMRDLMIASLARARRRATLATPYFLPGARLRNALYGAASRGVRVELLLAGFSDHPILRWAARSAAPRFLARGGRLFEYERAMMHAKVAVFDERWAVVGTSNLDRQSLERSYEVNLLVEAGHVPAEISAMLDDAIAEAQPVTLETLAARPWLERFRDRAAGYLMARL